MKPVTYERAGRVAVVTMDDGKANAMSLNMLAELHGALDRAQSEEAVVVLSGRSGVFSGGLDLRVLAGADRATYEMASGSFKLVARLFSFPFPVVIACTGHAVALGVFVVASGDYRIGRLGSDRMIVNEVAKGLIVPRTGIELLRYRMTAPAFDRAVGLAEEFSGSDAIAAGLLDHLVTPDAVNSEAIAKAESLASLDLDSHRDTKLRVRAAAIAAVDKAMHEDLADLASRLEVSPR